MMANVIMCPNDHGWGVDMTFNDPIWMKSVGLHVLSDGASLQKCRALSKKLGHLWGIHLSRPDGTRTRWLNAGRDPNTNYPTWSTMHVALYTEDQVAAILLVLEDGWPDIVAKKLF